MAQIKHQRVRVVLMKLIDRDLEWSCLNAPSSQCNTEDNKVTASNMGQLEEHKSLILSLILLGEMATLARTSSVQITLTLNVDNVHTLNHGMLLNPLLKRTLASLIK